MPAEKRFTSRNVALDPVGAEVRGAHQPLQVHHQPQLPLGTCSLKGAVEPGFLPGAHIILAGEQSQRSGQHVLPRSEEYISLCGREHRAVARSRVGLRVIANTSGLAGLIAAAQFPKLRCAKLVGGHAGNIEKFQIANVVERDRRLASRGAFQQIHVRRQACRRGKLGLRQFQTLQEPRAGENFIVAAFEPGRFGGRGVPLAE